MLCDIFNDLCFTWCLLQADFQEGVIRVQAPNLTKSSMAIQLDPTMTAGDIVSKFKVNQGSDTVDAG